MMCLTEMQAWPGLENEDVLSKPVFEEATSVSGAFSFFKGGCMAQLSWPRLRELGVQNCPYCVSFRA